MNLVTDLAICRGLAKLEQPVQWAVFSTAVFTLNRRHAATWKSLPQMSVTTAVAGNARMTDHCPVVADRSSERLTHSATTRPRQITRSVTRFTTQSESVSHADVAEAAKTAEKVKKRDEVRTRLTWNGIVQNMAAAATAAAAERECTGMIRTTTTTKDRTAR